MLIGPDDPIPHRPSRVIVAGTSGSGKTTLSSRIATILEIEHTEIDALFHGPNWTPRASFESDVEQFSCRPFWVTEWQYGPVRDRLAQRADLVVWLDLPYSTVMRQVVGRTVRRRLRREVLWNGNIEPPLHRIVFDQDNIVRWAWKSRHKAARRIAVLAERRPELVMVRLRSRQQVDDWVGGPLSSAGDTGA